ncbi:YcgL domain-containing protein [Thalassotalea sp. G2M2-11]|uniref:YcgL domain-containing protein n=1 Tax=Thalassotalea sp. G2M2-11 TaxID=2787627 RepID=UPI0019D01E4B|nr:YcgL domain-containing protein [Thalassotalea sp. G2M2-11]
MLCAVYRSPKKAQTYLFIKKRDDFSEVPEALMAMFGTPSLVTIINLANKDKLALADINKVKENLNEQGFYLQLPPPQEDLLKTHKAQMQQQKLSNDQEH